MAGWIKDYRKEMESNIWLMPPLYHRMWQYLKYRVNFYENTIPMRDGTELTIYPGQHLTSIRSLAKGIGWWEGHKWKEPNPKTIKTILSWLVKQEMISINNGWGNRQYTLITILNWEVYQEENSEGNKKVTVHGPDREQHADINKEVKNDKNEKNIEKKKNYVAASPRHDADSLYYKCALYMRTKILEINPNAKIPKEDPASMDKWSDDIRKIVQLDKRDIEDLRELVGFIYKVSDFWGGVVLSPSNLRKNWDKIYAQMKRPAKSGGRNGNVISFKQQMDVLKEWAEEG